MLLTVTSAAVDMKEAADLEIGDFAFKARGLRIACRVRHFNYIRKHGYDFTIRYRTFYNKQSEYNKIMNGHGDWFFYGFIHPKRHARFIRHVVINLDAFRENQNSAYRVDGLVRENKDKRTALIAFDIRHFLAHTPELIIDWRDGLSELQPEMGFE
jgi:hypothetical protein